MAENSVLVTISGAAFSVLLYENVRSNGDQIGLLLGNILTFITKNVTDGDRQEENVKYHINIDTVVTFSKDILKNGLSVDTEKLAALTKKKEQSVIGWFRFRDQDFLLPTLKDKILHKEFASYFLRFNEALEEHFIMFLLNSSTINHIKGTHKYRHVCFQYKQRTFRPVPLRVNNLGNNVASHDGSDYKLAPERKKEDDAFSELVKELNLNPNTTTSVKMVTDIQKRAEQYLKSIMTAVRESDEETSKLQQKVNELRARVHKSIWAKSPRQKERMAELQYSSLENEKIFATAQIHGSPRSTHSDDLFDSIPSPALSGHASSPSNSSHQNSHIVTRKTNIERAQQSIISKETRNHSSPDSNCDLIGSESPPESTRSTRSKEGTSKSINRRHMDERSTMLMKQLNSPKNAGRKSDRHSLGDYSGQYQDEYSAPTRREQSPRPSSYSENR